MAAPHRYSSQILILLALLFVTGCFAAASVMSLASETDSSPFQTRPTELLNRLSELNRQSSSATAVESSKSAPFVLPAEVMDVLKRTERGETLSERELIDAFLIASGVFNADQRTKYARQIDDIATSASKAIASGRTPAERGDALLQFLHEGPMKAGYDAEQTRLSVVLDMGKYNCVSATALYQIVARRLGLEVRALSIPGGVLAGHAMSIFIDGDRRIDVETTNPQGFNFRAKVKESGATVIGIQLDPDEGHEVSELGLASLIGQNLASRRGKDRDPMAAIQAALIGLCLDPLENSKANNFVAAINDWGMSLGDANRFEPSLGVLQFGLDLVPSDEPLKNNVEIIWTRYAAAEAKAKRAKQAVALVRRAMERGQLKRADEAEAAPFLHAAQELTKAKAWQEAIAVLEAGLPAVDGRAAEELRTWIVQVHSQWAKAERGAGNRQAAIEVLSALWKKSQGDRRVVDTIEYFVQEMLAEAEKSEGPHQAARVLAQLRGAFPSAEYLNEAGVLCASRALQKLMAAKEFEDAAAAIERYQPLLATDEARDELGGLVFDRWGRELVRQKQWQQAVKIYGDGLRKYSTSELLQTNAVAAWDSWAAEAMKKKDWREAIRIYELAIQTLGANDHLQHNLEVCRRNIK